MLHEQPGVIHHSAEECEMVNALAGQQMEAALPGFDLGRYDTMMHVFVRGGGGKLQPLIWPMRLEDRPTVLSLNGELWALGDVPDDPRPQ